MRSHRPPLHDAQVQFAAPLESYAEAPLLITGERQRMTTARRKHARPLAQLAQQVGGEHRASPGLLKARAGERRVRHQQMLGLEAEVLLRQPAIAMGTAVRSSSMGHAGRRGRRHG